MALILLAVYLEHVQMSEELKAALARITCLEGEIAKRDARIMGLESQYQRDVWGLNNEGDPIGGDPAGGYANDNARLRTELAALKAQGVVMPDGWIPLTIEHEPGYPEDVAFGPKRMMDRLKKWLDRYFEMRLKAAPVQQVSVPDGWRVERGYSPSGYVLHSPSGSMIRVCDSGGGGIETAFALFLKAMLAAAPSPAGVDGLNTDRNAAFKACPESGCDWGSFYLGWKARGEVEQAIIDGLRGENHQRQRELRLRQSQIESSGRIAERAQRFAVQLRTERDQHAQRIGELEGLLRDCYPGCGLTARQTQSIRERIDAALAAGKEGE